MNRTSLILTLLMTLLMALSCGIIVAQDTSRIDWNAKYEQLLESDPGVRKKVENGLTSKEEVIQWLQQTHGERTDVADKRPAAKGSKQTDLRAFRAKLDEFVASGRLSKEDAAKLAATMIQEESPAEKAKQPTTVDWDAVYDKLLKSNPAVRKKVEDGKATKAQVIEFLKQRRATSNTANPKGKSKPNSKPRSKPGARKGSVNFYAIVIGTLRSKDIELGELELDVDYVLSDAPWAKKELVGQRIKLVGVAGAFLDNLLTIKHGETIKVRTGDYHRETKVLGFGYKFQVLERTLPFRPEDVGVPPSEFRGFRGELIGRVVEAQGYEVLLDVQESRSSEGSKASNAESIHGKRVRIAGFYNQHADAFAELHEGDRIRVSVAHPDIESDAFNVTDVLSKVATRKPGTSP